MSCTGLSDENNVFGVSFSFNSFSDNNVYLQVSQLEGVYSLQDPHFWTLCSKHFVGSIRLLISPSADGSAILGQTHAIFNQVAMIFTLLTVKPIAHLTM